MTIRLVQADGKAEFALLDELAARSGEVDRKVTAAVSEILDTVKKGGDKAVAEYTRRFDGVDAPVRRIGREELAGLAKSCDPKVYAALERRRPTSPISIGGSSSSPGSPPGRTALSSGSGSGGWRGSASTCRGARRPTPPRC